MVGNWGIVSFIDGNFLFSSLLFSLFSSLLSFPSISFCLPLPSFPLSLLPSFPPSLPTFFLPFLPFSFSLSFFFFSPSSFFLCVVLGFEFGLAFARQALYHLIHAPA
jgi:hypothetical protein